MHPSLQQKLDIWKMKILKIHNCAYIYIHIYMYAHICSEIYFFLTLKKANFNLKKGKVQFNHIFNTYKPVQIYLYEEPYSCTWIEKKTLPFVDLYMTKIDKRSVIIKTIPFHYLQTCNLLFKGDILLHVNWKF